MISVLSTDSDNLFVVLSARVLNPDLLIVARAEQEGSEVKKVRAGADKIVSAYQIGAMKIAHTVIRPAVVDFLELATESGNLEVQLGEISLKEGSQLLRLTLEGLNIGRDFGVIVAAIKNPTGRCSLIPPPRV